MATPKQCCDVKLEGHRTGGLPHLPGLATIVKKVLAGKTVWFIIMHCMSCWYSVYATKLLVLVCVCRCRTDVMSHHVYIGPFHVIQ